MMMSVNLRDIFQKEFKCEKTQWMIPAPVDEPVPESEAGANRKKSRIQGKI